MPRITTQLFSSLTVAIACAAISQGASALSIGPIDGTAAVGRQLELRIPVQFGSDESATDFCPTAEVFFGENGLTGSLISTRLEEVDRGNVNVVLSTKKPVDEPVVTVYLRAGCKVQSVRKFVLLSEFSVELPVAHAWVDVSSILALQPDVPSVSENSEVKDGKDSAGGLNHSPTRTLGGTHKSLVSKRNGVGVGGVATSFSRDSGASNNPVARSRARLKLQPLDLSLNWDPTLRISTDLSAIPDEENGVKRANAVALWRALNASPEDVLQDAARRAALETEFLKLQQMSQVNQAALMSLGERLKSVQENRWVNPVFYGMLVALLGCGAFLGLLLKQRKRDGSAPWWKDRSAKDDSRDIAPSQFPLNRQVADKAESLDASSDPEVFQMRNSTSKLASADVAVEAEKLQMSDESPLRFQNSGVNEVKHSDFGNSVMGALRAINTQEMVDVRQQADFFLALGQHDEAIALLAGALSQTNEANPRIYLDLIELLHKLSRKAEYEKVRLAFNSLYTCHLPPYGEYAAGGEGLMGQDALLSPLLQVWPTPAALDYLERCIVREPEDSLDVGVDLATFHDLLLLHSVLGLVVSPATHDKIMPQIHRKLPKLTLLGESRFDQRNGNTDDTNSLDLDLS